MKEERKEEKRFKKKQKNRDNERKRLSIKKKVLLNSLIIITISLHPDVTEIKVNKKQNADSVGALDIEIQFFFLMVEEKKNQQQH